MKVNIEEFVLKLPMKIKFQIFYIKKRVRFNNYLEIFSGWIKLMNNKQLNKPLVQNVYNKVTVKKRKYLTIINYFLFLKAITRINECHIE